MRIVGLLGLLILCISCNKNDVIENAIPEVETSTIYEVTNNSVLAGGQVVNDGGEEVTEKGFLYGTTINLIEEGSWHRAGNGTGGFTARIRDLQPNTNYHILAYALNDVGMGTGEIIDFRTALISVTTKEATGVTANSAILGGEAEADEEIIIEEKGVFLSTHENPAETGEKHLMGNDAGAFAERVSGLDENTTYYFVAFAGNADGITLGETKTFSTVQTGGIFLNVNGHDLGIPYHRNRPLGVDNPDITRAIIVVHGLDRAGETYFQTMSNIAADIPGSTDSTIIISPQFLTEDDINEQGLESHYLYWTTSGWATGALSRDNASNPRPARVSSYALLDTVMYRLANSLPNLQRLVLVGHSAGGQLAHRMAVTSPMITNLQENYQIPVRTIVTNPSSYVYLNPERWEEGTTYDFSIPNTDCTPYDNYIYGLNELYAYMQNTPVADMIEWYKEREVVYFLGGNDNNPDAYLLDTTCQAMLQGSHRLERGQIFFEYVQHLYGPEILNDHHMEIVSGVGHTHIGMFSSSQGQHIIFSIDQPFQK